jgi:hypothetical protein
MPGRSSGGPLENGVPTDGRSLNPLNRGISINPRHPVDRWNEYVGGYPDLSVGPLSNKVGQRISVQNSLENRHLHPPMRSVVPLSTLSGGGDLSLLLPTLGGRFRPLVEGARRTGDLFIIPFEQTAPWGCQGQFDRRHVTTLPEMVPTTPNVLMSRLAGSFRLS